MNKLGCPIGQPFTFYFQVLPQVYLKGKASHDSVGIVGFKNVNILVSQSRRLDALWDDQFVDIMSLCENLAYWWIWSAHLFGALFDGAQMQCVFALGNRQRVCRRTVSGLFGQT